MAWLLHRFLGKTQLRKHARRTDLACATQSRRFAQIPFLLVWNDEHNGKITEAVRLAHFIACGRERNEYVELKRKYGSGTVLRIAGENCHAMEGAHCSPCALAASVAPSRLQLRMGQLSGWSESQTD
jgi:hypothetical protein